MWVNQQEVLIDKLTKQANQMGQNYFHEKSMKIIRKKGGKWQEVFKPRNAETVNSKKKKKV